jgi:hypothetical protein
MSAPKELVDHLAYVIGKYPRDNGRNPDGMRILAPSKQRLNLKKVGTRNPLYLQKLLKYYWALFGIRKKPLTPVLLHQRQLLNNLAGICHGDMILPFAHSD